MNVIFPTTDFMDQIERIREVNSGKILKRDRGTILAVINDPMMRLLLSDVISDNGYKLNIVSVDEFKDMENPEVLGDCKNIIFDFSSELFSAVRFIEKIINLNYNLILIYGEKDTLADDKIFISFRKLKKPFNVDDIIDYIESN
jgi:hypothetical protein